MKADFQCYVTYDVNVIISGKNTNDCELKEGKGKGSS